MIENNIDMNVYSCIRHVLCNDKNCYMEIHWSLCTSYFSHCPHFTAIIRENRQQNYKCQSSCHIQLIEKLPIRNKFTSKQINASGWRCINIYICYHRWWKQFHQDLCEALYYTWHAMFLIMSLAFIMKHNGARKIFY